MLIHGNNHRHIPARELRVASGLEGGYVNWRTKLDLQLNLMILAAILGVTLIVAIVYFRVSGDLEVCRLYYPEMSRMACYMSEKTVRVPNGSK